MFYPLTVRDFLDRAETVYPDRVALVDEPDQPAGSWKEITYRELAARARGQAAWLDRLGVPHGGRVAVVSQNSARLLTSFFGVSAWGRILVPINFRLTAPEVDYIVGHSGAEILLLDPELRDLADAVTAPRTFVFGEDDAEIFASGGDPEPWQGDEGATCTLNYTSGTTARPKGVQLTHRNAWLNATTFALHTTITDADVLLHTLPLFHVNGWGIPYAVTGLGGRHILLRKIDGHEILRRVRRHGVTLLCAAPAVVNSVLDAAREWKDGPVPGRDRVRVIVAGAPPPTRTIQAVREELGWEFIQIYGLTETSPLLTVNRMRGEWETLGSEDAARNLGRAGAPALGVRMSVSEDGEVLARSNHSLAAYWQDPDATAAAQAEDWFHTGDGGTFEGGYLTILDRKKDVIITGGENVSSIEVEDALCSHPSVREAAVVGLPDERWGEAVTAVVVTDDGRPVTEDDLIEHCHRALAGYKCPKSVRFVDSLPRTATGKTQKFRLREALPRSTPAD
jgi:acyl-CoA synthetase (AMP-forming)/AMP-acid ligase II